MNAEAVRALQVLEQLLDRTLTVDDHLDWDTLGNSEAFRCTLPMRPFIVYDDEGMPTDIEYLSMPTPRPEEPVVPVRPVTSSFRPDISILDKLFFREQRLLRDGENAYSEALKKMGGCATTADGEFCWQK